MASPLLRCIFLSLPRYPISTKLHSNHRGESKNRMSGFKAHERQHQL
jgi:hypothetical protein